MKNNPLLLLGSLLALVLSACPNPSDHTVKFGLNTPFSIRQGTTAHSKEDPDFNIYFEQVSNDSRCPVDVECITAGQADVTLTLRKGADSQNATITFFPGGGQTGNSSVAFGDYTITIKGLEPNKKANTQIKPEEYSAQLVVTK